MNTVVGGFNQYAPVGDIGIVVKKNIGSDRIPVTFSSYVKTKDLNRDPTTEELRDWNHNVEPRHIRPYREEYETKVEPKYRF